MFATCISCFSMTTALPWMLANGYRKVWLATLTLLGFWVFWAISQTQSPIWASIAGIFSTVLFGAGSWSMWRWGEKQGLY